jgi:hypothetical protein
VSYYTSKDLKYPRFEGEEIVNSEESLMSERELGLQLDPEHRAMGLSWNCNFKKLENGNLYQG